MTPRRVVTTTVLVVAALLWTATVGAMYRAIRRFESTPGRAADALTTWPARAASPARPASGAW